MIDVRLLTLELPCPNRCMTMSFTEGVGSLQLLLECSCRRFCFAYRNQWVATFSASKVGGLGESEVAAGRHLGAESWHNYSVSYVGLLIFNIFNVFQSTLDTTLHFSMPGVRLPMQLR
jgi:hypothetical protein